MHLLIAPNAFKHSLTASEAAEAIEKGLLQSRLSCTCTRFPVGDGGDGTGDLLIRYFNGKTISVEVLDPLSRAIGAHFGLLHEGRTAMIEMAEASGLRRLRSDELDPLRASSFGTGELIKAALDQGSREIILGVGGSATVDGGVGLLQALGVRFLDNTGQILVRMPELLLNVSSVDVSALDARLRDCSITVMCDVDNPLVGALGAAAVFGPQKGATEAMVVQLEAALLRWSQVIARHSGRDIGDAASGGAAGGVAAALAGLLGARLVSGIDYFLDLTRIDAALRNVHLVITGEGCVDRQTLQGKAPFGVAVRAKALNLPVIALAGKVPRDSGDAVHSVFDVMLPIGEGPASMAYAFKHAARDLQRTAFEIGNLVAAIRG